MTMASGSTAEILRAAKIVEAVVGNAWATDANGKFIYVTMEALAFLNLTLADLNDSSEEGALGWKRAIHPEDYEDAAAAWRHSLRTGEPYNVEHRMLRANGAYHWGRSTGQPLRDDNDRIKGWYGTVIDGHDPTRLDTLVGGAVFEETADSDLPPQSLVHPRDRASVAQASARAFFHGVPQISSYRRLQADGSYRWVELRVEPTQGASVDPGLAIAMQDHPWSMSQALGETREAVRAAHFMEDLYGGAWALDARGNFTYATSTAQTSIGMTIEDLNRSLDGRDFIDGGEHGWKLTVHPEDYACVSSVFRQGLTTGTPWNVEYRVLRANGDYVWHRVGARPTHDRQGRITGWYGVSLDIDVFKRTEAALRDSQRRLQQLIDAVPALIWSMTPDKTMAYVNRRFTEVTGATVDDLVASDGSPSLSVIHPDHVDAARRALDQSFATGKPYLQLYRQLRVDGSYRWTETRAEPLRDEDGTILQWYGVCVDVDDMMSAQKALQQSERMFRQLVETLPALIYCAAPDGKPIYRSQKLREFLGFNLEDKDETGRPRLTSTLDAIIHPDDLAVVNERYGRSLATGEPYALQHRLRRHDGEYRWVETRTAAMRDAEGTIVQWNGVCLDIEEQVRAQEELNQAQERLARASQAASLAELSASIAHEVNQPLAAIVANSHAGQRWLTADPPNIERAQKTVERITRDANAAADVVNRIRALFRQSVEARADASLAAVIAEAREVVMEVASRRGARLDVAIESALPAVKLDRVQIQQVLVNLIRNGLDAMDSAAASKVVSVRAYLAEGGVRIEISDRGPGVDFPDRIFEPFFTTKEDGMGMGLAICRSIIESHGGRLWVEKNDPQGAKFVFTLPIDPEAMP